MRDRYATQRLTRQRKTIVACLIAGSAILGAACSRGATESKNPPVRVARLNELAGDVSLQTPDSDQGPAGVRRAEVEVSSGGEVVALAPSHERGRDAAKTPREPKDPRLVRLQQLLRDW